MLSDPMENVNNETVHIKMETENIEKNQSEINTITEINNNLEAINRLYETED